MYTGIKGAHEAAAKLGLSSVCTGRWGCGAYGGDEILKFCIQWIACSECNK